MTRFKDFGSGKVEAAEPLSFKLHDEEFHCRPRLQGKALLGLVADSNSQDAAVSTQVVLKFFDDVLLPESKTRFDTLLNDPEKIVEVETLGEITGWLIQEYTDRPEKQPEAS